MLHVDATAGKSSPASAEILAKLAEIAAHHDRLATSGQRRTLDRPTAKPDTRVFGAHPGVTETLDPTSLE